MEQQLCAARICSNFMNAALKIPSAFPLLTGSTAGILCFGTCKHKLPFSVCGYRFQNELGLGRDCRFLAFGVSNRGESALLAHDFMQ